MRSHGSEDLRGSDRIPLSSVSSGRFGRMFRRLKPAPQYPIDVLHDLSEQMRDSDPPAGGWGERPSPVTTRVSRPGTRTWANSSTTTSPSTRCRACSARTIPMPCTTSARRGTTSTRCTVPDLPMSRSTTSAAVAVCAC